LVLIGERRDKLEYLKDQYLCIHRIEWIRQICFWIK
jgi:hypothetical protein